VPEMLQCQALEPLEAAFFRSLNAFVEPFVRAGFGSPGWWPTGAIVLETKGRKTGRTLSVPVLATLVGGLVVVATVRRRSHWIKNLASTPDVRFWMGGRVHDARAYVVRPDAPSTALAAVPPLVESLVAGLSAATTLWGVSFAVLVPEAWTAGQPADRRTAQTLRLAEHVQASRGANVRRA
jgi:deazaflavin-dependent oxidoreductase (nitroreductase family)